MNEISDGRWLALVLSLIGAGHSVGLTWLVIEIRRLREDLAARAVTIQVDVPAQPRRSGKEIAEAILSREQADRAGAASPGGAATSVIGDVP